MKNEHYEIFLTQQREDTMGCGLAAGVDKCVDDEEIRKRKRKPEAETRRLRLRNRGEKQPSQQVASLFEITDSNKKQLKLASSDDESFESLLQRLKSKILEISKMSLPRMLCLMSIVRSKCNVCRWAL